MTREPLDLWLYGTRVATLRDLDGRLALDWTQEALDRWGPGARVLSAKLSLGDKIVPPLVKNYLDGLLPEGNPESIMHLESVSPLTTRSP